VETSYYSWERLDGTFDGLVRRVVDDDGLRLEKVVDGGAWVKDTARLMRYFVDPGRLHRHQRRAGRGARRAVRRLALASRPRVESRTNLASR